MELVKTQKVLFVVIELIEKLFQNKVLMSALCFLDEFKPDELNGAFDFFRFNFLERHIGDAPLGANEANKSLVIGDIETEIIVEVEKLLLGHISIGSKGHQSQQFLSDFLFAFVSQFKLFDFRGVKPNH